MISFFKALIVTILVEGLVIIFLDKSIFKVRNTFCLRYISTAVVPTTITLPIFWYALPLIGLPYLTYVTVGEVAIVLIEAVLIMLFLSCSYKRSLLLSFTANIASIAAGFFYI